MADFNAPHENNWTYDLFYLNCPDGVKLYRLPGGMDPNAENIHNLPDGRKYYQQQIDIMGEEKARRMVHNEPGFSKAGKPVWPEFSTSLHAAQNVPIQPETPLYIGLDQGNNPGAVILQLDSFGRLNALDEIHEENLLPTAFAEALNHKLNNRFKGLPIAEVTSDPAAFARNNDTTWADIVMRETGLSIVPAFTNDVPTRLDCVRRLLTKTGHQGRAMFVLDSQYCPGLYHAMNGGYQYRKLGNGEVMDKPLKNAASNIADAVQYGIMGATGEQFLYRPRESHAWKRKRSPLVSRMKVTI